MTTLTLVCAVVNLIAVVTWIGADLWKKWKGNGSED